MKLPAAIRRSVAQFAVAYRGALAVRVLVWVAAGLASCLVLGSLLFHPTSAKFSYTTDTCVNKLTVLPNLYQNSQPEQAEVKHTSTVGLFNYPLIARATCYKLLQPPKELSQLELSARFLGSFVSSTTKLSVGEYPQVNAAQLSSPTIATKSPIVLSLSEQDQFFSYSLHANNSSVECVPIGETQLACQPDTLQLQHATEYTFTVSRYFRGQKIQDVASAVSTTVTPVTILSTSIEDGSVRYDKPAAVLFTTDKPLLHVGATSVLVAGERKLAHTSTINDKLLKLTFTEALPRDSEIGIKIDSVVGQDQSTLLSPYFLNFKTSGGPRVVRINIGDRSVALTPKIVITFDQELQANQPPASFASIKSGGQGIGYSASTNGRTITLKPNNSFTKCQAFSIAVAPGLVSALGVGGGSAWNYQSRTSCYTLSSIGTSAKGRNIQAYSFGSGSKKILFSGGVHGDEANAKAVLDKWVYELEGNPDRVPNGKSIVVVPLVNPDGYAVGSRVNANGVDLNRNFPANNWKASVKMPSGVTLPTGGGASPLSEPESSALANYVTNSAPALVMSYHSSGGIALANDAGNSWALTKTYAALSGYGAENSSTIGTFFDYDTTGAFEDWLKDKKGIPAVLIELTSKTNHEFAANRQAMWRMVSDF